MDLEFTREIGAKEIDGGTTNAELRVVSFTRKQKKAQAGADNSILGGFHV